MDLKDIKVIIDLMKKNSLSEFELEKEGFKIKLKRGGASVVSAGVPVDWPVVPAAPPAVAVPAAPAPAVPVPAPKPTDEELIKSPMIGTFYRAPAPDASAYVEVGAEVNPESVVCIIEAMKVMNEIKAEAPGVIVEVIAENGKPVEFGQPLFKIRPA
ncbi:MAG: acetyl-CoA carboxylase biotin carboxyl carrier protein [Verrucomicrobiales bacterium]|nr:acetyl-CoA carboxylase biotin carboxyl carrier protein [Verrucomicrobiales bacterium]